MRTLVTGGAGFIGSNLVDRLIEKGHDVTILDNLLTGKKENINPKAKWINMDVRDSLEDLEKVDVIFHLAALARIQPSFKNPAESFDINLGGTVNICEFARKSGARIVYAGSSSFYAGPYLNPYSFTKWQSEEVCKMYSEVYDLPTAIARFFNVYGYRQTFEGAYATVVGIFERQYRDNEPLTITDDGEQRRDFTHVDDIVSGLIKMSEDDNWRGEIFNLGTGKNHSINELASLYNHQTTYIPKRPGEARITLADLSFSKEKLNYEPSKTLENYVKNWLEENK